MVRVRLGPVLVVLLLAAGCAPERGAVRADREPTRTTPTPRPTTDQTPRPDPPTAAATEAPEKSPGPAPSDGRPTRAVVSIPALDLAGLAVVPYRGRTDDAPGTRIQNAGDAASPHGPRGGVGPGGIGNYQVTGHRLSSTMPFRYLPGLRRGDVVRVDVGAHVMSTRSSPPAGPRSGRRARSGSSGPPYPGAPGSKPRER